jgi:hypothetical protein
MARMTYEEAADAISLLREFRANTMHGTRLYVMSGAPGTGHLPEPYAKRLQDAQRERTAAYLAGKGRNAVPDAPLYIIYSYETPIAWVTLAGEVVIPAIKYSQTTSRHATVARRGLARLSPAHVKTFTEFS